MAVYFDITKYSKITQRIIQNIKLDNRDGG